MKRHRLWLAALVAGLIIVVGIYWNQGSFVPEPPDQQQSQSARSGELEEFDGEDWEVAPNAQVQLDTETTDGTDYTTFRIPGQLLFPEDTTNRQTRVKVRVRPVPPDRAEELSNTQSENLMRELFKGGLDQALERQSFEQTVTTDAQGKFSIEDAVPGIYELTLSDTRWMIANQEPRIELANRVQPLQYEVSPTARLHGRVVDPDGNPLEAIVVYTDGSDSFPTDEQGEFTLDSLAPGEQIDGIAIHRKGYRTNFIQLSAPKPGDVLEKTFTLSPAARLRVHVQDQAGEPVTDGNLILERNDDKTIHYGSKQSVPHGEGKITDLNNEGVGLFESLQPGEVVFGLTFTNYLSSKQTVTVEAGKTRDVTHTVTKGTPVILRFVDESTGEPARDIEPAIRAYDKNGNELTPAFQLINQTAPGKYKGVVHPATETVRMKVTSPMHTYKQADAQFNRTQFPELEVQMVPSDRRTPPGGSTPPGLLQLKLKTEGPSLDWEQVQNARIDVLNRTTGEQVHSRTGGSAVFSERLPLDEGSYVLYGLISRNEGDLVVYKPLTVSSQNPGQRMVSAAPAASVTGRVTGADGSPAGLRVGVSLLPSDEGDTIPYYPGGLSSKVSDDGSYHLTNLPAGTPLQLQVLTTGQDQVEGPSGQVIDSRRIEPLSSGETRTLPSVSLDNQP